MLAEQNRLEILATKIRIGCLEAIKSGIWPCRRITKHRRYFGGVVWKRHAF